MNAQHYLPKLPTWGKNNIVMAETVLISYFSVYLSVLNTKRLGFSKKPRQRLCQLGLITVLKIDFQVLSTCIL